MLWKSPQSWRHLVSEVVALQSENQSLLLCLTGLTVPALTRGEHLGRRSVKALPLKDGLAARSLEKLESMFKVDSGIWCLSWHWNPGFLFLSRPR